jgi:hypothetical protein
MRARRPSSFSASFFTSSGMPADSIFCFSSSVSRWPRPARPVLSGSPSSARAGSTRAASAARDPALRLDLVAQLLHFQFFGQVLIDFSSRTRTSVVSSVSCLSAVESEGSDEAMKSTSRPGSSMFIATVESSSESVGEPATICWNKVSTLRCSASISESWAESSPESWSPARA